MKNEESIEINSKQSDKIIGLCGSLQKNSLNKKLLHEAVRLYGNCDFKETELSLPLYNNDEENLGFPKNVLNLTKDIKNSEGVIITSPEYNKGISGVLKNALDWISRVPGSFLKNKPVVVMSAAAGRSGGETSQYMVRSCLTPFGPRLISYPIICVANASKEFNENGILTSDRYIRSIKEAMANLKKEIYYNQS